MVPCCLTRCCEADGMVALHSPVVFIAPPPLARAHLQPLAQASDQVVVNPPPLPNSPGTNVLAVATLSIDTLSVARERLEHTPSPASRELFKFYCPLCMCYLRGVCVCAGSRQCVCGCRVLLALCTLLLFRQCVLHRVLLAL